jgi:hypothetical protein
MFKDCPHEGFAWPKYLRSTLLSTGLALAWQAAVALPLGSSAGARVVLFGLVYVTERGLVELYKGYFREEDQSKYFIPMQLHIMGRVVHSRPVRWSVALAWVAVVLAVVSGLMALGRSSVPPLTAVLLVGSVGGWLSAFGGAFKDAPIEGFETFKFFRSPVLALLWSLVVACFTNEVLFVALCGLGYTVATTETYKTFFFPNKPRGKFAGKPILFPDLLRWRYRFAPLYAAIWLVVLLNIALAFGEPGRGLLRPAPSGSTLSAARLQE